MDLQIAGRLIKYMIRSATLHLPLRQYAMAIPTSKRSGVRAPCVQIGQRGKLKKVETVSIFLKERILLIT